MAVLYLDIVNENKRAILMLTQSLELTHAMRYEIQLSNIFFMY